MCGWIFLRNDSGSQLSGQTNLVSSTDYRKLIGKEKSSENPQHHQGPSLIPCDFTHWKCNGFGMAAFSSA